MPTSTHTYASLPGLVSGYTKAAGSDLRFGTAVTALRFTATGTAARLFCTAGAANPFWVSVDGGAWSAPTLSGGSITLFTGLADAAHIVDVAVDAAYVWDFNAIPTTGTLIEVDGASPAASVPFQSVAPIKDATCAWYFATEAADAGVTPTLRKRSDAADSAIVAVRTATSQLWVLTRAEQVMVSVDSATPVRVAIPASSYLRWTQILTSDGQPHTFRISSGCNQPQILAVGSLGAFSAVPAMKRVVQFGDSITQSLHTDTFGMGEAPYISAALGCLACANGHGGATTAQIAGHMAPTIAVLPQTPDIVVLASGRNDSPGSQFRIDYANAIETALNTGARRVVCRGVAPGYGGIDWGADIRADVEAAVAFTRDDRVAFVDTGVGLTGPACLWPDISSYDGGVHPDAAGYVTMGTYIARDYPAVWSQHYSVFIVAGQSNANGMGSDAAAALASGTLVSVSQYSQVGNGGALTTGNLAPITISGTPRIGPEYSMARALDAGGAAPYVIRHAAGGIPFHQVNASASPVVNYNLAEANATYAEWARLKTTVQNGLAALTVLGDTYDIRAFIWIHGESDSKTATPGATPPPQPTAANAYSANLEAMLDALAVDGWDGASAKSPQTVVIGICNRDAADTTLGVYGQIATVQAAQAGAASLLPAGKPTDWIQTVDTRGFAMTQGIHLITGSVWAVGEMLATLVARRAGTRSGYGGH